MLRWYNSRELCDKAVDAFLPVLKFVPYWFVTSKILKKLYDVVFSNDAIVFVNEYSDNMTFLSDDIGINTIEYNDINFDNDDFGNDNPETVMHVRP